MIAKEKFLYLGTDKEKVWLSEDLEISGEDLEIPEGTWGVYESELYRSEQKKGEEYLTKTKDSVVITADSRGTCISG